LIEKHWNDDNNRKHLFIHDFLKLIEHEYYF